MWDDGYLKLQSPHVRKLMVHRVLVAWAAGLKAEDMVLQLMIMGLELIKFYRLLLSSLLALW